MLTSQLDLTIDGNRQIAGGFATADAAFFVELDEMARLVLEGWPNWR